MLTFALVEDDETYNPTAHGREDLTVFSARLSQRCAGGYAVFNLEVLNERLPIHGQRVFIAEDGLHLIDGYITSPRGQVGEIVEIEIIAQPFDSAARKNALAQSLKTAPGYDELTIPEDERDDIQEIMKGYAADMAWDRVTHEVTAADIYQGSTHVDVDPFLGSLSQSTNLPPSEVRLKVVASWRQIKKDVHDAGTDIGELLTMTPEGFLDEEKSSWPEAGDKFGTGFMVLAGAEIALKTNWRDEPVRDEVVSEQEIFGGYHIDPAFAAYGFESKRAFISTFVPRLRILHLYALRRTEKMTATIPLSLQPDVKYKDPEELVINLQELTEDEGADPWQEFTDYVVGDRVHYLGQVREASRDHNSFRRFRDEDWVHVQPSSYIESRRFASFAETERGHALMEHMLERGRVRAMRASRYVELTVDCEVPDLSLLGADTTATINDPALIGGSATGKITEYEITWADGIREARITIACAPGNGGENTIALGGATIETPDATGRVIVDIQNDGKFQRAYFEEFGKIPMSIPKDEPIYFRGVTVEKSMETIVDIETEPAPAQDYDGTAEYEVIGVCAAPQGVRLT